LHTPEDELRAIISSATPSLLGASEAEVTTRIRPDAWSPKEIIGHLIDSAANNHRRFVEAQFTDDLLFPGYDQDGWVSAQGYQDLAWSDLVTLWSLYNLHLASVMAAMPASVRHEPRARHALHAISWEKVPEHEPATLDYMLSDYVGHLKHHLKQVYREIGRGYTPDAATHE